MKRAVLLVGVVFGLAASLAQAASFVTTTVPTGRVAFARAVGQGGPGHLLVAVELRRARRRSLELWSMPDGHRVKTLARSSHTFAPVFLGPDGRGRSQGAWLIQDRVGRQVMVWAGSKPRRLTETHGFATGLAFAAARDGNAVVAWGKQGMVWAAFRSPRGEFGRPEMVVSAPGVFLSAVAIAQGGAAAMTWAETGPVGSGHDSVSIARRPPRGSFGAAARVSIPPAAPPSDFVSPGSPAIAITQDGRAVTTWSETEVQLMPPSGARRTATRVVAVDWPASDPQPGPRREFPERIGPSGGYPPQVASVGRSVQLEWPSGEAGPQTPAAITSVAWPPSGPRPPVRYVPPRTLAPGARLSLLARNSTTASLFLETRAAGWWVAPSRPAGGFGHARRLTPRGRVPLGLFATTDGGPGAAWDTQLGRTDRSIRVLTTQPR
jgi:hypothetical protein